jgi:hypothetical protein
MGLLKRKEKLEEELAEVNEQIAQESIQKDIEALMDISDTLNGLHQDDVLEKHDDDMCGRLYTMMEDVDRIITELEDK